MPRYRLVVEYDGRPYVGWQIQGTGLTVHDRLVEAAGRFCGKKVSIQAAEPTDAGVHALGQVCHVDLTRDWDEDGVRDGLNAHLPPHPIAKML